MKRYFISTVFLLATVGVAYWVVKTYRAPGSMTVVESQAMDMTMQPPLGAAPVALDKVNPRFFQPTVTLTGSVVAWSDEDVVARVAGRVLKTEVYPGDPVHHGQLLALLDSDEVGLRAEAAHAMVQESVYLRQAALQELEKSQLEVRNGQRDVEKSHFRKSQTLATRQAAEETWRYRAAEHKRSQALYDEGGISLEELQKSRSDLAQAQADLDLKKLEQKSAETSLDQALRQVKILQSTDHSTRSRAGALAAALNKARAESGVAQVISGYTQLRALQSGVVVQRLVSPGTLVQPGQILFKLQALDKVRLQARVPQEYAGRIERGARVLVTQGNQKFECRVTADFVAADPVSRTFTVEAAMPNLSGKRALRGGEFVEMQISLGDAEQRLFSVPVTALQHDLENRAFVWVAERQDGPKKNAGYTCVMHPEVHQDKPGDCPKCGMPLQLEAKGGSLTAKKQSVEVSGTQYGQVGISQGLSPGMEVVVAGHQSLHEGEPIVSVEWSREGPVKLPPPPADAKMPDMPAMDHSKMPGMNHSPGKASEELCLPNESAP